MGKSNLMANTYGNGVNGLLEKYYYKNSNGAFIDNKRTDFEKYNNIMRYDNNHSDIVSELYRLAKKHNIPQYVPRDVVNSLLFKQNHIYPRMKQEKYLTSLLFIRFYNINRKLKCKDYGINVKDTFKIQNNLLKQYDDAKSLVKLPKSIGYKELKTMNDMLYNTIHNMPIKRASNWNVDLKYNEWVASSF